MPFKVQSKQDFFMFLALSFLFGKITFSLSLSVSAQRTRKHSIHTTCDYAFCIVIFSIKQFVNCSQFLWEILNVPPALKKNNFQLLFNELLNKRKSLVHLLLLLSGKGYNNNTSIQFFTWKFCILYFKKMGIMMWAYKRMYFLHLLFNYYCVLVSTSWQKTELAI